MQLLCASASGEIVEIGRLTERGLRRRAGQCFIGQRSDAGGRRGGFAGETRALMAVRAKEHV